VKTDTLTGHNLSYHIAALENKTEIRIDGDDCLIFDDNEFGFEYFSYADPATFQPIAEREGISCTVTIGDNGKPAFWSAMTLSKISQDNAKYQRIIKAHGDTEAEARMRCYVKSYLGDDTKGD